MTNGLLPDFYADKIATAVQDVEWDRMVLIYFNGLNGVLKKDGNQWCAITGEMPEHYIAGFRDSPYRAIHAWYSEFCKPITQQKTEDNG